MECAVHVCDISPHQILFEWTNQEKWQVGVHGTYAGQEMCMRTGFGGKLRERDNLEHLGIDGRKY